VPLAAQKKAVPAKPIQDNKADAALAVVIGRFNIHQGDADFTDMSIKPVGFAIEIHALNGNIRSLSSRADVKSDVVLEGRLNEGSKVKIFGKINPFSYMAYTDLVMSFKDVNLTTLTPYSAKFAGYRIEKGKLSMELRYQLENGQLTAANSFVLDQLQLGERVDSPDATSLPIRLAIALLKDSDGKIDIQLPLTGDLSNPEVSVWGLLSNAAGSLLRKVIAAPFALMGSLMGSSGEELEAVAFAPGLTALTNPEKEQLAVVAKGLKDRPGISLEIKGSADAELDRPVLAEQDLSRQLKNAKQIEIGRRKGKEAEWDGIALSDEDYTRLFTNLYRWKTPDAVELQGLKPTESLSGNTLETAKHKLLENWKVSEMDLRSLAQARAESIRSYLVKDQGLPDQRIYLSDVKLTELDKKGAKEIKALLSLSGS
jgi:outer membrane protein OmpA-like peptidoglycan-associated protein